MAERSCGPGLKRWALPPLHANRASASRLLAHATASLPHPCGCSSRPNRSRWRLQAGWRGRAGAVHHSWWVLREAHCNTQVSSNVHKCFAWRPALRCCALREAAGAAAVNSGAAWLQGSEERPQHLKLSGSGAAASTSGATHVLSASCPRRWMRTQRPLPQLIAAGRREGAGGSWGPCFRSGWAQLATRNVQKDWKSTAVL